MGRLLAVPRQQRNWKLVAMGAAGPQKAQALVIVLALRAPWETLLSSVLSVKLQLGAGVAKSMLLLGSAALHCVVTAGLWDAKTLSRRMLRAHHRAS